VHRATEQYSPNPAASSPTGRNLNPHLQRYGNFPCPSQLFDGLSRYHCIPNGLPDEFIGSNIGIYIVRRKCPSTDSVDCRILYCFDGFDMSSHRHKHLMAEVQQIVEPRSDYQIRLLLH
jgi:hypothetical protein